MILLSQSRNRLGIPVQQERVDERYTSTFNGNIARNEYADTVEEREKNLEELIREIKAKFGIR